MTTNQKIIDTLLQGGDTSRQPAKRDDDFGRGKRSRSPATAGGNQPTPQEATFSKSLGQNDDVTVLNSKPHDQGLMASIKGAFHGTGINHWRYTGTWDFGSYSGEWQQTGEGDKPHGDGTETRRDSTYTGEWEAGRKHGRGVITSHNDGSRFEGQFRDGKRHHGRHTYPDGASYDGEWRLDEQHGHGVMRFSSGSRFEGEFRDGKRHGRGIRTWADGTSYDGEWRIGKQHGHGVETSKDSRFEGNFEDGKRHGRGIRTWADGTSYDGEWCLDKQHGHGVMHSKSGSRFEGEFRDGKRHHGRHTYPDGASYDGEWQASKPHGQGISTRPDASTYAGQWEDGYPHGQGTATHVSGFSYDGEWRLGKQHGEGVIACKNGDRFEGHFEDGKKHGRGIRTWADGRSYDGEWRLGKQHGHGVMHFSSGSRFEGEFRDGKRHHGRHTYPDGASYDGEWRLDEQHGHGVETYKASRFEGHFEDGKRHGRGVWEKSNGRSYDGEWRLDKMHGHGVMNFKSGSRFEGEVDNGKQHGPGVLTKTNEKIVGRWKNGLRHGDVQVFKKDGTLTRSGKVFRGSWLDSTHRDRAPFKPDDMEDENDADIQCIICAGVLDDPVQLYLTCAPTKPCGPAAGGTSHTFCRRCVEDIKPNNAEGSHKENDATIRCVFGCHGTVVDVKTTLDQDLLQRTNAVQGSCGGFLWVEDDLVPCPWKGTLEEHRCSHRAEDDPVHYQNSKQ